MHGYNVNNVVSAFSSISFLKKKELHYYGYYRYDIVYTDFLINTFYYYLLKMSFS